MYNTRNRDTLLELRGALKTTSNNDFSGGTTAGGAEVNKKIQQMIVDQKNRGVDFSPLIDRKPLDQLAHIWNIRRDLGFNATGDLDKFTVYAEGAGNTPYPSRKRQLIETAISYRADYEVSGLHVAASASYYNAIADEAKDAIDSMKLGEERMMICGSDTNAYGIANGFNGLLQLMRWHSTNGGDTEGTAANKMADTTTVGGTARAAGTVELDVSYVIAGTVASATAPLELKHLDKAFVLSNKHGGKDSERIWFCSEERAMEISQLLQPQQRFAGTLQLEGGFSVQTYRMVPIIGSRFMDKNGATNTGAWDPSTDADNSMYLLDLDSIEMRILKGVDSVHVPIMGLDTAQRNDVSGGYFKTYALFVMTKFTTQVHICNLSVPA